MESQWSTVPYTLAPILQLSMMYLFQKKIFLLSTIYLHTSLDCWTSTNPFGISIAFLLTIVDIVVCQFGIYVNLELTYVKLELNNQWRQHILLFIIKTIIITYALTIIIMYHILNFMLLIYQTNANLFQLTTIRTFCSQNFLIYKEQYCYDRRAFFRQPPDKCSV